RHPRTSVDQVLALSPHDPGRREQTARRERVLERNREDRLVAGLVAPRLLARPVRRGGEERLTALALEQHRERRMLGRLVEDDAHPEPARPALRHSRLALAVLVLEPGVCDVGGAIAVALVPLLLGARFASEVDLEIVVGDLAGLADQLQLAAFDEHGPVAEALDRA